jgi:hypothetical protein
MTAIQLPTELSALLQTNQLQKEFQLGLRAKLEYRAIAEKMTFPITIGQTLTATRSGYLPAVETPLNPATNTNLDNGLTPVVAPIEQYRISVAMYGLTQNLNLVANAFGIADQFQRNSFTNGENAARSLDTIARNALFDGYMGGNTRTTVTLGSPGPTIQVDDIRGFDQVLVNGQYISVNGSTPLSVLVGSNDYNLIAVGADAINTSATFRGISGTLTFATNVSILDSTQGNPVTSNFGPAIFRPNDRSTSTRLVAGDTLTMALLQDAVAYQRDNAVPDFGGFYNCYLDNQNLTQLFRDPDFRQLYQGGYAAAEYRNSRVVETLGLRFITTTQAPVQAQVSNSGAAVNLSVRRTVICGADTLVEGTFEGQLGMPLNETSGVIHKEEIDGAVMVVRAPIDRAGQIIAQTWYSVIGYVAPTDATANSSIIPTASNAYLKRATILETVL